MSKLKRVSRNNPNATKGGSGQRKRVAVIEEPSAKPCRAGRRWRTRLLRDDLTGTDLIEIRGFRSDGTRLKLRFPAANRSDAGTIARELDSRSARIPHGRQERREFVDLLIRSVPAKATTVTSMPGFREGGTAFVMPTKMYGAARGKYAWDGLAPTTIGQSVGTLEVYKAGVLRPICKSPLLCAGVMCALAAPLCNYVFQRTGNHMLPESMILFFHGRTTTGKSTILRVASSVYGSPNVGIDWGATDRAVAEAAYSRNDLLTLIDDTEKSGLYGRDLYQRLRLLGQRLPAGESRAISKHAQKQDLAHLRWMTIGMASGPIASTALAATAGMPLDGQAVRFFDLAVPVGGVMAFDSYEGDEHAQARAECMEHIEKGMARSHGVLMDAWIEFLIEHDMTREIRKRVDWFVKRYTVPSNPITIRIGRKIGLLYAAGRIAQRAGLLPWNKRRPWQVAKYVYNEIIRGLTTQNDALRDVVGKLRTAISDECAFLRRKSRSGYVVFGKDAIGLRIEADAKDRWLLYLGGLTNLGVPAGQCALIGDQLLELGIITRSGEASGTVQERVMDGTGRLRKVRFWKLHIGKLRAA